MREVETNTARSFPALPGMRESPKEGIDVLSVNTLFFFFGFGFGLGGGFGGGLWRWTLVGTEREQQGKGKVGGAPPSLET